jgi:hypothetical protein
MRDAVFFDGFNLLSFYCTTVRNRSVREKTTETAPVRRYIYERLHKRSGFVIAKSWDRQNGNNEILTVGSIMDRMCSKCFLESEKLKWNWH